MPKLRHTKLTEGKSAWEVGADVMPVGMMAAEGPKVASFAAAKLAKAPEFIDEILERLGRLGFDTLGEAKGAIRSHPDWASRWDMAGEGDDLVSAIEQWRKQSLMNQPPQPSTWSMVKDYLRGLVDERAATLAPPPNPPGPYKPFLRRVK